MGSSYDRIKSLLKPYYGDVHIEEEYDRLISVKYELKGGFEKKMYYNLIRLASTRDYWKYGNVLYLNIENDIIGIWYNIGASTDKIEDQFEDIFEDLIFTIKEPLAVLPFVEIKDKKI